MRLADYIIHKKLTRTEFARQIGVTPAHITNICNGWKNPSLSLAEKIEQHTEGKVTFADLCRTKAPSKLKNKKSE